MELKFGCVRQLTLKSPYLYRSLLTVSLVLLFAGKLLAADHSSPDDNDFKVVEEAVVRGEFKGCSLQVGIPIGDKLFLCTTFGISPPLYYPKVIIFQNKKGEYKLLINGVEYRGYFYSEEGKPGQ